ncbi:nitroreductase family deazaflavin-dependent oxidoreductase [Streptosporangiaceae bacterium NEAU-GS5]|nr:nitroreductase family deazaflavin-dependent oxidoreductase [Streptosporangiaceae bacterium NEAU-GS5]
MRRRISAPLKPFFQWLAATDAFAAIGPKIVPRTDRLIHRLTRGRVLMGDQLIPHLMLTTIGNKSGQPRDAPLACCPEESGSILIVGSNFGRGHHPAWTMNLMKHPAATVSFKGRSFPVTATLLTGAEREAVWPALLQVWPVYDRYTEKSGRELRVFRLTPQ